MALALQSVFFSFKEAKTARIFSKVRAGASSKVKDMSFLFKSTSDISTFSTSQYANLLSSFSVSLDVGNGAEDSICNARIEMFWVCEGVYVHEDRKEMSRAGMR